MGAGSGERVMVMVMVRVGVQRGGRHPGAQPRMPQAQEAGVDRSRCRYTGSHSCRPRQRDGAPARFHCCAPRCWAPATLPKTSFSGRDPSHTMLHPARHPRPPSPRATAPLHARRHARRVRPRRHRRRVCQLRRPRPVEGAVQQLGGGVEILGRVKGLGLVLVLHKHRVLVAGWRAQ